MSWYSEFRNESLLCSADGRRMFEQLFFYNLCLFDYDLFKKKNWVGKACWSREAFGESDKKAVCTREPEKYAFSCQIGGSSPEKPLPTERPNLSAAQMRFSTFFGERIDQSLASRNLRSVKKAPVAISG